MEAATTTLERRVREIPPTRKPEELLRNYDGKMRVAAYCRVSTDSEDSSTAMKPKRPTTPRRFRTTLIGRWRAFTQMRASPEPASKRERSSIR